MHVDMCPLLNMTIMASLFNKQIKGVATANLTRVFDRFHVYILKY